MASAARPRAAALLPALLLLLCLLPARLVASQALAAAPAAAAAAPRGGWLSPAPRAEAPATAPAPGALPFALRLNSTYSRQQPLVFCVPMWEPFSVCDSTQKPSNYTGYDPELIRAAADRLGLTEGADYTFRCVPFTRMINSLKENDSECTASIGGVTISSEREAAGISFSYPTLTSSLGILVQSTQTSADGWGFVRPFAWDMWLALLISLLVFPFIIFFLEFASLRRRIHRGDIKPGVVEAGWRSALTLLLFDSFTVSSHGARIAVLCFMFLALLVTSTYTANLAAFVTVRSIAPSIDSIADLRGKAVGTSPIYLERLRKYGIQAIPYPFNKGTDYLEWRGLVQSGELAAIVRDRPALEWLANTALPLCDVMVLPQSLEPFDYGIAFHVNTSDGLHDEWSAAVLALQEQGNLQTLRETWITSPLAGCAQQTKISSGAEPVHFIDMWGLWCILGCGVASGFLFMFAQRWKRRQVKERRRLARTKSDASVRSTRGLRAFLPRKPSWGPPPSARGTPRGRTAGVAFPDLESGDCTPRLEEQCGPASAATTPRSNGPATSPFASQQAQAQALAQPTPREQQQQQQQQQQTETDSSSDELEQQQSSLQVVDSVFAAGKWKSKMRSMSPSRKAGGKGGKSRRQ